MTLTERYLTRCRKEWSEPTAVRWENMFVHARVPETVPAAVAPILEKELANEAAFGAKLENWLVQ